MAAAQEKSDASSETVVEFVGVRPYGREFHEERSISSADWKRVGIDAPKMVWNLDNGFRLAVSAPSAALLEYFQSPENGFKVL